MELVEVFVKEPCSGWAPYKWEEIGTKPYDSIEELLQDFASHGKYSCERYKILKSWQKRIVGSCFVYCLEMKSEYQLEHPEHNQAEYHATLIISEE